jgi:hypothetical protein
MDLLVVIIVLGAALASVAVYAVVGRVLPGRWRKSDVEESEASPSSRSMSCSDSSFRSCLPS